MIKNVKNSLAVLAFTLAEVLIVMGIIGIVAEMTIPTIKQSIDKQTYVTGLKKAYSTFNQALMQLSSDAGCTGNLACTGVFATGTDDTSAGTELAKYFKIIKTCGNVNTPSECDTNTGVSFYYDGSGSRAGGYGGYAFITADGTFYRISNYGNGCSTNISSGRTSHLKQTCGSVIIDVNGVKKGPNNFGRDIFYFYLSNGKGALLYPRGGMDDTSWWYNSGTPWTCSSTDFYGIYCAGRIFEEGLSMTY